ncbi:hypothetical protein BDV93DRAFT_609220 [Ceratobasidium sp. AG-I]|nr:hypothetical protein BDV93DRAFT_609220 [Ceratobasidium sp. AG-I]
MSKEQRVGRINELYAQVRALQDSGRILHDNISKTSYEALDLIEKTLAARGLPSIEQSYQQLLKTLPDAEARNIEKSLQQAFLDPEDSWTSPMKRLTKFLISPDTGLFASPQVTEIRERCVGIWSRLSSGSNTAFDAKIILAQPGIGLLIGVTREMQAIKAAIGGAIEIAKDIAPAPMMVIGALVAAVAIGLTATGGKHLYDSLKDKVQKEHDRETIEDLVASRLYARVRQRYLELMNNQAGIIISIGILLKNGQDPQALVAAIESTAEEAIKQVTESAVHAYYQIEDERNKSWIGEDPSLARIEDVYKEKLKRLDGEVGWDGMV